MEKGLNRETLEWGYLRNLKTEILKENQKARTCENKGYNVIYNPAGKNFACWDNKRNSFVNIDRYYIQKNKNLEELQKAKEKCRLVLSSSRCQTVRSEGNKKYSVSEGNKKLYFHYWATNINPTENDLDYYISKKPSIVNSCKTTVRLDWLKNIFNQDSSRNLEKACEDSLVYWISEKKWVVLKQAFTTKVTDDYPISFDWNGNLLHPKKNEVNVNGQWKIRKIKNDIPLVAQLFAMLSGAIVGITKSAYETVEGVVYIFIEPVDTAKGIFNAASDPEETAKIIYNAIEDNVVLLLKEDDGSFTGIFNSSVNAAKVSTDVVTIGAGVGVATKVRKIIKIRKYNKRSAIRKLEDEVVMNSKTVRRVKKLVTLKGTTIVKKIGKFGSEVRLGGLEKAEMVKISKMPASRKRWTKGEQFWYTKLGGERNHYISYQNTARYVDVYTKDGLAVEVKTYFGNSKVTPNMTSPSGAGNQVIKDELLRDVSLSGKLGSEYKPLWIFNGNGPNNSLIKLLEDNGIQWIQIIK